VVVSGDGPKWAVELRGFGASVLGFGAAASGVSGFRVCDRR
jgi:hypothetical protein